MMRLVVGEGDISSQMVLEKLKLSDVNGLVGNINFMELSSPALCRNEIGCMVLTLVMRSVCMLHHVKLFRTDRL